MCAITASTAAIIGIATSVIGTGASLAAQSASASAQADYQSQLGESRNLNFLREADNANTQKAQLSEASARELFRASEVNEAAKATAKTSLAETGSSGVSVDSLLSDYDFQKGVYNEASLRQEELGIRGISSGVESQSRAASFASQVGASPIAAPDYASAGLGLIGSTIETGSDAGLFTDDKGFFRGSKKP
jgi:hypothetical protein